MHNVKYFIHTQNRLRRYGEWPRPYRERQRSAKLPELWNVKMRLDKSNHWWVYVKVSLQGKMGLETNK